MSVKDARRACDWRRRQIVGGALAGGLLAASGAGFGAAPPSGRFRLVMAIPATPDVDSEYGNPFTLITEALAPFGYVEGRNLAVVRVWVTADARRREEQLAEVRADRVDAVLAPGAKAALRWQKILPGVPIVAWGVDYPVEEGVAASFPRPGGMITGTTQGSEEIPRKQVQVLRQLVPGLAGITVMAVQGPGSVDPGEMLGEESTLAAVREAGLKVQAIRGTGRMALASLETMGRHGYQAAIYTNPPLPLGLATARQHAQAAIRHRIATIGFYPTLVDSGFLAAYGELEVEWFKRMAQQLDRIFRGAKPGDIPFIHPSRYVFALNQRTALALGIAIAPELRVAADRVVE